MKEIFEKYDTNHVQYGTDKGTVHSYVSIYEKYLKDKKINNLLEVGVAGGYSLLTWRDIYPNASIIGIDIDTSKIKINDTKNISILKGDATNARILTYLPEDIKFDVIIDDGSHEINDIINTLVILLPVLDNNGLYFIEDIQNKDEDIKLIDNIAKKLECDYDIIDLRSNKNRYDDVMVILYKKQFKLEFLQL